MTLLILLSYWLQKSALTSKIGTFGKLYFFKNHIIENLMDFWIKFPGFARVYFFLSKMRKIIFF